MAENIATTANESVARGIEGSGQAQIIGMQGVDPLAHYQRGKAMFSPDPELVAKNKKAQDEASQKLLDTDFDKGWQIHDNEIQHEVDMYRNKVVNYGKNGGDFTDVDFQRVMKEEQDRIELLARRSTAMKDSYKQVYELVAGKGKDNRYNENAFSDLQSKTKSYDEEGNIAGARGAFQMSEEEMRSVAENPDNFDMGEVWTKGLELFDQMVVQQYDKTPGMYGSKKEMEKYTMSLMKTHRGKDGQVRVQTNADGLPILDIDVYDPNDEAKKVLMNDDFVSKYVRRERQKYADEDGNWTREQEAKIWEEPIKMMRSGMKIEQSESERNYSKSQIEGAKDQKWEETGGSIMRRTTVSGGPSQGDKKTTVLNPVFKEWTISPKGNKEDKTILVQPSYMLDQNTGELISPPAGNIELVATTVIAVPWSNEVLGPSQGEPEGGNIGAQRIGSRDQLFKDQLNSETAGVKYMIQGTALIPDPETEGLQKEIQVMIPYEDGADMIKAKTGFDLNDRDYTSFSDEELIDYFRKISDTKLSPKQLKAAIQKVRDLGQTEE